MHMDTHALKNKNASLLFYKGFPPFIHCFVLLDFYGCQIPVLCCFKKCLRLYVEIPFCSFVWWYICSFLRQSMFFDVRSDENMSLLTVFMVWIHLNNLRMDILCGHFLKVVLDRHCCFNARTHGTFTFFHLFLLNFIVILKTMCKAD